MKNLLFLFCGLAFAQAPQARIAVKLDPIAPVTAKAGETISVVITGKIDPGYHVNGDKQADPFLIPLKLTWTDGPLEKGTVAYPKSESAKLAFSEKPVNILSGDLKIETRFKVAAKAASGTVTGKLRFQACNDRECLIPRTIDVSVPVEIVK